MEVVFAPEHPSEHPSDVGRRPQQRRGRAGAAGCQSRRLRPNGEKGVRPGHCPRHRCEAQPGRGAVGPGARMKTFASTLAKNTKCLFGNHFPNQVLFPTFSLGLRTQSGFIVY